MGHYLTRRPTYGFNWNHQVRLVSALAFLGILYLMIRVGQQTSQGSWGSVEKVSESTPAELPKPTGPTDLDADERAKAEHDYQAINDRTPLDAVDMPTYWRFLAWSRAQPFELLRSRADPKISVREMFERSAPTRGKIVRLNLTVRQALQYTETFQSKAKASTVYEIRGWMPETQSQPYIVVFEDLPEGFPLGLNLREKVRFVGYFLKIYSYEDGMGEKRLAPVLVGKVEWTKEKGDKRYGFAFADWKTTALWLAGLGVVWYTLRRMLTRWSSERATGSNLAVQRTEAEVVDWLKQGSDFDLTEATDDHSREPVDEDDTVLDDEEAKK